MTESSGKYAKECGLALLLYVVATVLLTYPLALHPSSHSRLDNADAQLNAWAISWVAHQAPRNPLELFQANTFHPLPNSLAFSEHLFLPGVIAAPILSISNDLVLTNNALLFFGIVLSALGMYVLVYRLTQDPLAAFLAGLFFSFAPYRFVRLPHIQMQIYGFLPLALAGLHLFFDTGKKRWAVAFAAFFVFQALSGTYLAAITAVACGLVVAVLGIGRRLPLRRWIGLAGASGLAGLALLPFVRPYLWVNRTLGIEWDLDGVTSLSATVASYFASPSRAHRGWTETLLAQSEVTDYLFPGFVLIGLGVLGGWVLFSKRTEIEHPRLTAICYLAVLVAGFIISLGPRTPFYPILYEYILFFRGLRALTRFGLLPLLSLCIFSGFALAWLLGKLRSRPRRIWVASAIAAVFIAESAVIPLSLERFEDDPPEVYEWLKGQGGERPIVELPYKRMDTRYMFWARHHGFRPMLNGDSGFIPQSHVWMREIFLRFPSADSLELLRSLDVSHVVVHLGAYRNNVRRLTRLMDDLKRYEKQLPTVASFGRDLVVCVEGEEQWSKQHPSGAPLAIKSGPTLLVDGGLDAVWQGEKERSTIEVVLREAAVINGLKLHYGRTPRVPVTRLEIEARNEHGEWIKKWESPDGWPALTPIVVSLLDDPADGIQVLSFDPMQTDALRLIVTGYEDEPEIAEIEIVGR
jgi:hypothetical protein